jgi:hypothetical protein
VLLGWVRDGGGRLVRGGALGGVVAALSAATVGAVIAGRRARHPVGRLLLGLGLGLTYQAFGSSYSRYGLVARPGALPGAS